MKQLIRLAAVVLVASLAWTVVPAGAEVIPGAPSSLGASPLDGAIALRWQAPPDATLVTGYRIYRGADAESLQPFDVTDSLTYTDTGLANGNRYHYAVAALAGPVEGAKSEIVAETAGRPAPVRNLQAKEIVHGNAMTVTLTWERPATHGGALLGYRILEWTGTPTELRFLSAETLEFTDRTTSDYVVYVVIAVGEFGESDPVNVTASRPCEEWC